MADRTIDFVKESESKLEKLSSRKNSERDNRPPYLHDYARILYSSSFRRLQGKMQLLGIDSTHFFRNRLTHSLEVAQIARGLAAQFEMGTTLVVEAAALAHDIGNPPFGHHGEQVLNNLIDDIGGFEGNAQTFRILRTLEKKHNNQRGLNLTYRTLLSTVKYFNRKSTKKHKFLYNDDYSFISDICSKSKLLKRKSIDAQIMDLADEIAYAAHDLEDCLAEHFFTIDELLHEFYISTEFKPAHPSISKLVESAKQYAGKGNQFNNSEEYAFLFRKRLTSLIVNELITDVKLIESEAELGFAKNYLLARGLKKLVFRTISRRPSVQLYEKMGEKIIEGLFEVYTDNKFNKDMLLMPAEYRVKQKIRRSVVDYISGMMDQFAVQEYERYFGKAKLSKMRE